ncbi:MAG: hypothetical protein F9K31_00640 [Dokdonella sp.]|nr:MAG: hypothetical protein F9K31_00640 [Dokdonella sp.]
MRFASLLACMSAALVPMPAIVHAIDLTGTPTTIVASRGGATVTLADIDAFAGKIPPEKRAGFFLSPARIENTIDGLLLTKQLAAEARATGLDKDPAVARQMELAADEALALARRQQFEHSIQVPDMSKLAQEEYLAHKDKYVQRGNVVVEHILVGTSTRSDADAMALARDIEAKARANPGSFEALVEQYSDDPSKVSNHGKLEDAANPATYDPDFIAGLSSLRKPNDISPVVATRYGYHIIKLLSREPDTMPTFAQVKDQIVRELSTAYVAKTNQAHTTDLSNMNLDLNAELVRSLQSRYLPAKADTKAQ